MNLVDLLKPMSRFMVRFIADLFSREPVKLAIVRKYQDVNGGFIGELYRHDVVKRKNDTFVGYRMIGVSLDTLPVDVVANECELGTWRLDTRNDFLAPMGKNTIRVGALDPKDNDGVRREVGRVSARRVRLVVQNRFIEGVSGKGAVQC